MSDASVGETHRSRQILTTGGVRTCAPQPERLPQRRRGDFGRRGAAFAYAINDFTEEQ